jgi:hypothetical protein
MPQGLFQCLSRDAGSTVIGSVAVRYLILIVLVVVCLPMTVRAQEPTPHRSFEELVTSNGYGAGHFSVRDRKVSTFFPHLYRQYDEGEPIVRDWLFDAYFGLRRGSATWFPEIELDAVRYMPGTGIIEVQQTIPTDGEPLRATQYVFAPFDVDLPAEVMLLRLENTANSPLGGFAAFSLHNFHVGDGDEHLEDEVFERLPGRGWLEKGASGELLYLRSLVAPDGYAAGSGPESPFSLMKGGADFEDTSTGELPPADDVAAGFQFNVPAGLEPGESIWFGVVMAGSDDADENSLRETVDTWVGDRPPEEILAEAQADWDAYQSTGDAQTPNGLSLDERAVWRQSLAMLRMGQVREPNGPQEHHKPNGQILAALPKAHPAPGEGIWNISWPRDASYAIAGLSRAGYAEAARAGLEFMLNADAGEYRDYVGHDYAISVCRYYGRGREESDWNDDGPNVEFDDFGLFLMALGEQLASPGLSDPDWWKPYWPNIRDRIADVLVKLQDDTGLISPDSSIWERHWNGNQKHFTFSSAVAARGLCVAAGLAAEMGEPESAATYRQTVARLRTAIRDRLVDEDGVLAGSLEELEAQSGYIDLAAVEAFNFGLLDPAGDVAEATLDRWRMQMYDGAPGGYGGYYRNDDGDWYDSQE